jgi:hypothetical protein
MRRSCAAGFVAIGVDQSKALFSWAADYFSVAISPGGKLVAAIDATGAEVHVWNAATGAALVALPGNGAGRSRVCGKGY